MGTSPFSSISAELWKYRYYENNTLIILREEEPEQLIKSKDRKTKIVKITKDPRPQKSIEEHLQGASNELKDLFYQVNDRILDISSEIERYSKAIEVVYKTSLNIAYIAIQNKKNCIRILVRTENDVIDDPKNITKKIPKHFGYGNVTRQLFVYPKNIGKDYSIDDIMDIIMQSYSTTQ